MLSRVEKAKYSILWYFFIQGCVIGNWAAILPFVKDEQHISNGLLGLILISAIGGALLALPIITYLNDHYGSGLSTIIGSIVMLIFYPIVGINYHLGILITGIFLLGFGAGCTDVSINGQAVLYEKHVNSSSLGMFHAMYSIGGLGGALLGGIIMGQFNISVLEQTAICSISLLFPSIFMGCFLWTLQEEKQINQSQLLDYEQRKYEKLLDYNVEEPKLSIDNDSSSLLSNSFNSSGSHSEYNSSNINGNIVYDTTFNPALGKTTSSNHHSILSDVMKQQQPQQKDSSNATTMNQKIKENSIANNNALKIKSPNFENSTRSRKDQSLSSSSPSTSILQNQQEQKPVDWQVYELQPSPQRESYHDVITVTCQSCMKYTTLIQISFICLLAYFGEGSIGDWSAIYLSDDLDANPTISCLGYVGFSLCVAFGRYFSDYFVEVIGRQLLLQYAGVLSSIGLSLVVIGPWITNNPTYNQVIAIIGFSICGLGISAVAPCVISLAGSHDVSILAGLKPAESIAYVTSIGYLGIMISPPLLGELSMLLSSLRWSYAIDAMVILIIAIIASMIRKDVF